MSTYYAGMDVGSTICELVVEDEKGQERYAKQFATSERNILGAVREARKECRGEFHLTFEEGEMAQWLLGLLRLEVDRLVICDPKRNAWIARDTRKADRIDARKLARLLRGGFLSEVYHPIELDRAEFKRVVQHYHDLTVSQARFKHQIKAKFRCYGIVIKGDRDFLPDDREKRLALLPTEFSRQMLKQLYALLDSGLEGQDQAKKLMVAMGRKFPEVTLFREVYGVGPVWACTFSAYIQTPHRFRNKRKLWRFCQLGISDRSSNGEPLGYRRLDPQGVGMLKKLSFQVFWTNLGADTDFKRFYLESLNRTKDKTHARLNTQRKILATLWAMWRKSEPYRSQGGVTKGKRYALKKA